MQKAIAETISRHSGQPISLPPQAHTDAEVQPMNATDLSVAIAYTHLLLEDADAVTQRHIKMLRNHFSIEQIHALNCFIKEKTSL